MGTILNPGPMAHPDLNTGRKAGPGRLDHIDGLRGIAALAVVIHHLVPGAGQHFDFGRYGVLVFFMISGYVVPFSLTRRHGRPLAAFAVSRFFRLYPAYWLSLAMAFVLAPPLAPAQWLVNITMAQRFLGVPDALGVYWTLAVELVFYVLCAGLFVLGWLGRVGRLGWLLAGLSAATLAASILRVRYGWALPFSWLGFLSLMVAGAVVRCQDETAKPRGAVYFGVAALFAAVQLTAVGLVYADPVHQRPMEGELAAWAAAFVTVLLIHERPAVTPPGSVAVGRISYSLYLFHATLGDAVARWAGLGGWTAAAAGLAAGLAAAALCWQLVERPSIRAGHSIARALDRDTSELAGNPRQ